MKYVRSFLIWCVIVGSLPLFFIPAVGVWIFCLPFDPRQVVLHSFTSVWGYFYAWLIPGWKIRMEGKENIRPQQVYVMISNHQSASDIAVLFGLFRHFKWVSKKANFRIPIIGWVMHMNKYIVVDKTPQGIKKMLENSRETLLAGSSVMIFPEGTRSLNLKLGRFREGAFHLALETGLPLLPILIEGTGRALKKKSFVFSGKHLIRVRIMPEIPFESFKTAGAKELCEQMHQYYLRELDRLYSEYDSE